MKMKKRLLGILLSLVMVLGLVPGFSLTALADETKIGSATYTISDDVLTVGSGEFSIDEWASVFGTGGTSTSANSTAKSIKSVTFESGATLTSDTSKYMFFGWTALRSVDLTNLTASNVTHIGFMFMNCQKLTSVAFGSEFDTSKVNNMRQMFSGCSYLTVLDLSTFKSYTGNGKRTLYQMFYNCSNLETIRVSDDWNVTNTEGDNTFFGCYALEGGNGTKANGSGDYTKAVIDKDGQPGYFTSASVPVEHRHKFSYSASGSTLTATCSASNCGLTDNKVELTLTPPAKTVYGDSNSAAATLEGREAFNEATGLNISSSSSQYYVYYKKGSDNQLGSAPTTPGEYTVKVTISNVAGGSYTLTADYTIAQKEIGLTWADTTFHYDGKSHVPTATATGLVGSDKCDVTVTGEQTAIGNYTATASGLSNDRYKLPENTTTEFAIEGWVGTARYTIEEAPSPKKLFAAKGISHEITNGVLTIYGGEFDNADWKTAFANDYFITNTRDKITSVRFVKANDENTAAKLTDSAEGLFKNWSKLESIDFTNLDTSEVTWMGTMFAECSSLTELDLSPLDTKKVTNMSNMFYKCSKLEKITVGANWQTASSTSHMFSGCDELAGNAGTSYKALFGNYINADGNEGEVFLPDVNGTYARLDGGKPAPGFFYNAHQHQLTYSVDQSKPWTITATCNADGCYLGDSNNHSVSISLVKPTLYVYYMDVLNKQGDEYDKGASPFATLTMQKVGDQTLQDSTTVADPDGKIKGISISVSTFTDANTAAPTFKELTGATIGEIEYYEKGSDTKLDKAPSDAGTYTAKVTIGDATASIDYRIAKRFHSPVLTSPTKNPDFVFGETDQDLIIPGTIKQVDTTDTSTFEYALGTDATTIPTDGWSTDIPKGTGEGPFYVFYRVAGDKNHGSAMKSEFPNKSGYANTSNPEHESNSYKPDYSVIVISSTAPTPPTPNELNYTGGDQALVTAGSTTVGKMQYALGEIKTDQPSTEQGDTTPIVIDGENKYMWKTGEWSDTVPKKTEPGVYYVLYRVVSTDNPEVIIANPAYVTATIGKVAPTAAVPAATATYGQTLNDVSLTNPTGNTEGTWAWAVPKATSVGNVGTNSFEATFTPTDTTHYKTVTVNVPVTVNKATPSYTTPTSLTATYGQTLADVELPEHWAWTDSETSVGNAGDNTFTATFTPEDTDNYNVVTGINVTVTVGKADPTVAAPTPTATYGQTLNDVTLTNPSGNIEGTWSWTGNTSTSVGNVGEHTFKAKFTPQDNTNYNEVSDVDVTITVEKADPTANAPTGLTATYGQTLANVMLNNPSSNTEGTWAWVDDTTNVGSVGNHTFKANFTPTSSNYKTVENVNVSVTVSAADPTTPTNLTATYGQTLEDVTLPDGWAWKDSTTSVGEVGTNSFKADYTATSTNYNSKTDVDVTVTVGKANAVAATVTANNRTYDGTEKPLVTVAGETIGGTLKIAVTTVDQEPDEVAYTFDTTSIPTAINAGTYYVWYKVVGDASHSDSTPAYVIAQITQYIPPHSHSYTSTVTKEPTCTEAGERTYRCSCGNSYKETIKATGHTLVAHEAKEATCGEDGNKAYWECTVCEKLFADKDAKTETTLEAVTIGKATGEHTLTSHKAVDVTCTEDGNKAYWECSVCKKLYADAEAKTEMTLEETVIKAEGHKLTAHEAKEATCTEDGNKAYWECSTCKKLFADKEAKTETTLEAVTEKAKGHTFTAHEAKEVTCTEDGSKAYWECSVCKKLFADAEGKTETTLEETVIKAEGHKLTAHEAKEATCTEDGNKAYWECTVCKKLFADAEGKTETTEDAVAIKSEGHKLTHVEAKEPTEEEDGNIEYWTCSECGKFFSDAEGKNEIGEEDTKISKYIDITKATVTGLAVKAYTGKAITPVITVKYDGKTLKKGTDYTVAYANNTNVGAATVTITGKGDYAGAITKKFLIKQISFKYRAYVQKKNWMSWSTAKVSGTEASKMAGTTDNLRMETIQMQLSGVGGSVEYRAYCAKKGWTQWATTADTTTYAGTKGEARRVEMIQLRAKGQVANLYDMYFRAYSEKLGWLNWAKNGEKAGTQGYAYKLEAFQVNFVRKGETFKLASQNKKAKSFYDKTRDGEDPE